MEKSLIGILFAFGEEVSFEMLCKSLECSEENARALVINANNKLIACGLSIVASQSGAVLSATSQVGPMVAAIDAMAFEGELTAAAISVLTIVAYGNDFTVEDVTLLRGVSSGVSVRNLIRRGLVEKNESVLSLTTNALVYLGVTSVFYLPNFSEHSKQLHAERDSLLTS